MSREDDLLASAFKSVRETYEGHHDEADLTLQRALFKTRGEARKRKIIRFSILPIAAALAVSSAWAGATGHLGKTMQDLLRREEPVEPHAAAVAVPAPVASEPAVAPLVTAEPVAPVVPEPVVAASPPPPSLPPPVRPAIASPPPVVLAPPPPPPVEPVVPSPAASAPDPAAALFAEAHRLHFREKDPARALAAWDAYLKAAPDGPLSPEAHYNRALTLVRLGRKSDAMSELAGFANGSYRGYRQAEARKLLDALQSP